MTRKKLILILLITAPLVFAAGFLHFSLVNDFKYNELRIELIACLIPAAFVFAVLRIVYLVLRLCGLKNKAYKPYVISGGITFFAMCIGIFIVLMDKNTFTNAILHSGYIFCFHYAISALILSLFLWGINDKSADSRRPV